MKLPKLNAYKVIADAVNSGLHVGIQRAFKHTDSKPNNEDLERIRNACADAILLEICERFEF